MMKKMIVPAVMAVMMLVVSMSQQAEAVFGCSTDLSFNRCRLNRQSKIIAFDFKRSNGDKRCASALSASPPTCLPCRPDITFVFRDG